jgi:hypothetical protein
MVETITKKQVAEEILRLDILFQPSRPDSELRILANVFYEHFKGVSKKNFTEAISRHVAYGRYFPRVVEITEHLNAIARLNDLKNSNIPLPMELATKDEVKEILKPYRDKNHGRE